MNLFKFLQPKTVSSVRNLDKTINGLKEVVAEQKAHAEGLQAVVHDLEVQVTVAKYEATKAEKLLAGINKLIGA